MFLELRRSSRVDRVLEVNNTGLLLSSIAADVGFIGPFLLLGKLPFKGELLRELNIVADFNAHLDDSLLDFDGHWVVRLH